ncbi:NHP2-like protein 1, partial [Habropoda laboriosa]
GDEVIPGAYPLASVTLSTKVLNLVHQAVSYNQVRKGVNEATKTLNRGLSEFIVLAEDARPLEVLLHLPLLCEHKNVPYIFIKSRKALGRACGVTRPIVACAVTFKQDSQLQPRIQAVQQEIERLLV